jgi:hypothetical protein
MSYRNKIYSNFINPNSSLMRFAYLFKNKKINFSYVKYILFNTNTYLTLKSLKNINNFLFNKSYLYLMYRRLHKKLKFSKIDIFDILKNQRSFFTFKNTYNSKKKNKN